MSTDNVTAATASGDAQRLAELEAIIESGLQTFVEVGNALLEIRDRRFYREQGFRRFEEYCRKRWNMSQPHAQRMIDASEVAHNLIPMGITPGPSGRPASWHGYRRSSSAKWPRASISPLPRRRKSKWRS